MSNKTFLQSVYAYAQLENESTTYGLGRLENFLVLTITFLALLQDLVHILTHVCEQANKQERKIL